ncbi:ROK family protein [Gleimia sp. 6138-11-ORH1]|uniref:ROK family protein n=1 Tax=Gleimia sp. 6138-11-ORH1 TaxID=2973937 RepID=UPI00216827FD|nr:ROK family protein [Gleimia sp. 6138-11-ORH1]MCS4484899.1 ROK family protein [Gleimia sp. 6138-11-ORH1]
MPINPQFSYPTNSVKATANIRLQNTVNVIHALSGYPDWVSLNDLQLELALSRPTLNAVLASLEKIGLVNSTTAKTGHALGGRKPQLFLLNPHHHNTLVMRINLSGCTGRVISASGTVLYQHYIPHGDLSSPESTFVALTKELKKHTTGTIYATVIAVMGIVHNGQLLRSDTFPSLTKPDWVEEIKSLVSTADNPCPVQIVNDAKVATEWMHHLLQQNQAEPETLMAVHCSDTVGAGLIFNGKLLEGARGAAGEILLGSDIYWHKCRQLLKELRDKYGRPTNEIFSTAGICELETELIQNVSANIGHALIPIINLLDPEVIAIGGAISDCGSLVKASIAQVFAGKISSPPEIYITPRGTQSVLSGCFLHAGQLALETVLLKRD